jgi:DNA-binding IclR family transcriptional regulator
MSGVQSIERAFAILRVLASGPTGVTDIADRTSLPKSTVSRLLSALEAESVVQQTESGGDYELGNGLSELSDAVGPDASMAAVVRPILHELHNSVGESTGFTVRIRRDVYWVDNVDQEANVQIQDKTGHYARMHSVASGVALLAHLPDHELDRYLDEPLERLNERTPTDPRLLRDRLEEIRDTGVFWSFEELEEGLSSIAVPFRGPSGEYEAALYIEGPSFRFPADGDQARVQKLMVEAAAQLSERFTLH